MNGAFGRICDSGRAADFGGRWTVPCTAAAIHKLGSPPLGEQHLDFCDKHMRQLIDAGLVAEPYLTNEEFAERQQGGDWYGEGWQGGKVTDVATVPVPKGDRHDIVVVERIEPGVLPEYCTHGRVTCMGCREWCWLGDKTHDLVKAGEAVPLCHQCAATAVADPKVQHVRRVEDHRRSDGPH